MSDGPVSRARKRQPKMKIQINISDSGSCAIFVADLRTAKITVVQSGGMPVEKLAARATYTGTAEEIKLSVEDAWNCDCKSAVNDPFEAEISNVKNGKVLA
jgi:hypothetical protein